MAILNYSQISQFINNWSQFGPVVAAQAQSIIQLLSSSPVDISDPISAAIILSEAFCQLQMTACDMIMTAPDGSGGLVYDALTLNQQGTIASASLSWKQMFDAFGNIAFNAGIPNLDALRNASPSARMLGAESIVVSIEQTLESYLNVPGAAGLSVSTFWSFNSMYVELLASLLAIDPVLSVNPPDYNYSDVPSMLSDILLLTSHLNPINPNVAQVLSAINTFIASGLYQRQAASYISVNVPQGGTIESLALLYTGDADNWPTIAAFNNLAYPYIAENPRQGLGDPFLSYVSLASDAHPGDTVLNINNPGGLALGQQILLEVSGIMQVVTIEGGDLATLVDYISGDWDEQSGNVDQLGAQIAISVSPAINNTFPAATTNLSFFPAPTDKGMILQVGGQLKIPSSLLVSTGFVASPTPDELYGVDIQLDTSGNFIIAEGDFQTIGGVGNLAQALQHRFDVPQGEYIEYPTYGFPVYLGKVNGPARLLAGSSGAAQTAMQDPRIASVSSASAEADGDTLICTVNVVTTNGEQFPPLAVSVPLGVGGSS